MLCAMVGLASRNKTVGIGSLMVTEILYLLGGCGYDRSWMIMVDLQLYVLKAAWL